MNSNPEGLRKKPYELPSLRVYGDIMTMTQSTGSTSKNSDGSKSARTG